MYRLYIANRNYSSWSLRGWLCAKLAGAPFEEVLVQLAGVGPNPAYRAFSPHGLVPCLHDGDVVVWESHCHRGVPRRAPRGHVAGRAPRACLRPVDLRRDARRLPRPAQRHDDVHSRACRRAPVVARHSRRTCTACGRCGTRPASASGPAGTSCSDRSRSRTPSSRPSRSASRPTSLEPPGEAGAYWRRLLEHPFLREWEQAALAETTIIEPDEPRVIYRDKLAAAGRLS